MNAGIEATSGRYVLALNPDCRLEPDFAAILARRLDAADARDVGSASGRLLRADGQELAANGLLDSTGIYFTASGRHFDRGAGGARGLALSRRGGGRRPLRRRGLLPARRPSRPRRSRRGTSTRTSFSTARTRISRGGLRNLGWRSLYVPTAVAHHRRRNLPERRRQMTELANRHSVKNRFLLRVNNQSGAELVRTFVPTFARDLVVLGACLTVERSSLPAFGWLWTNRKRLWAKRREIQAKVAVEAQMRLAILGTRGIPARYGGFETLAEELSARLAARGHDVTVYTRTRYAEPGLTTWRGAKIRVLPTVPTKYLDTVVHGVVSGIDAAFERFDAVLVCNAINAASCFLPRLSGRTRVVLNVDGLERNRRKWNAVGPARVPRLRVASPPSCPTPS